MLQLPSRNGPPTSQRQLSRGGEKEGNRRWFLDPRWSRRSLRRRRIHGYGRIHGQQLLEDFGMEPSTRPALDPSSNRFLPSLLSISTRGVLPLDLTSRNPPLPPLDPRSLLQSWPSLPSRRNELSALPPPSTRLRLRHEVFRIDSRLLSRPRLIPRRCRTRDQQELHPSLSSSHLRLVVHLPSSTFQLLSPSNTPPPDLLGRIPRYQLVHPCQRVQVPQPVVRSARTLRSRIQEDRFEFPSEEETGNRSEETRVLHQLVPRSSRRHPRLNSRGFDFEILPNHPPTPRRPRVLKSLPTSTPSRVLSLDLLVPKDSAVGRSR